MNLSVSVDQWNKNSKLNCHYGVQLKILEKTQELFYRNRLVKYQCSKVSKLFFALTPRWYHRRSDLNRCCSLNVLIYIFTGVASAATPEQPDGATAMNLAATSDVKPPSSNRDIEEELLILLWLYKNKYK